VVGRNILKLLSVISSFLWCIGQLWSNFSRTFCDLFSPIFHATLKFHEIFFYHIEFRDISGKIVGCDGKVGSSQFPGVFS